jgi:uncharacterized membrane protein
MTDLGTEPGGDDSVANAINDAGQAGIAGTSGAQHAALWSGGAITDLGTIDGIADNQATAINRAGQVVGTADPHCQPCVHPVAWLREPSGTLTDLDTLIPAGSGWSATCTGPTPNSTVPRRECRSTRPPRSPTWSPTTAAGR